jgi:carbonic anhydrase
MCRDVDDLYECCKVQIDEIDDVSDRNRRFAELNVWKQVEGLSRKPSVEKAIHERGLKLHAFMYDSSQNACFELRRTTDTAKSC